MIKKILNKSKCDSKSHLDSNISCVRCGKSICPKCIVHSPVGVRCGSCGESSLAALNQISTLLFFKTLFISSFTAGTIGLVSVVFSSVYFYLYWINWLWILIAAYLIYEIIDKISGYKRGFKIQLIGMFGLSLFIVTQLLLTNYYLNIFTLLVVIVSFYFVFLKLK